MDIGDLTAAYHQLIEVIGVSVAAPRSAMSTFQTITEAMLMRDSCSADLSS
jgi:hypothetical protein